MPNPSIRESKALLRQRCRKIPVADVGSASLAMVDHLHRRLLQQPSWHTIALFLPLDTEPDLTSLLEHFPERRFAFPRVTGKSMAFHVIRDLADETTSGPWGLREPHASCPIVPHQEIDLMLCPGMAFSRSGHRLGKGGGFYDRFLSSTPHPPYRIGVTFADHLLDAIPHEAHDILMNDVLTEHGFCHQNGASSSLQ